MSYLFETTPSTIIRQDEGQFFWKQRDSRSGVVPPVGGDYRFLTCLPLATYVPPLFALGVARLMRRATFARSGIASA
jgi:hypothetical protein